MEHKGTIELTSERLILRKFTMEDANDMYRNWVSDPEVTKYLRWPAHENQSVTETILKSWIEEYENLSYIFDSRGEGQPIRSTARYK